jgi:pimeloyl-ACP methyl ester carboxylesterase
MDGAKGWTVENERVAKRFVDQGLDSILDARAERIGRHGGNVPIYHLAGGLAYVRLGIMRMPPLVECTQITVPTLVLVGENDVSFRNSSEYMAAKIPKSEAPVVIPEASHWCNFDNPEAWNTAVMQFLTNL